jgi:hypothetical protein
MCGQSCDVQVKDFESLDDVDDCCDNRLLEGIGSVYMH